MANPCALITGASGGIGLELARVVAANGHDVVLVARSADRLAAVADELRSRHRVAAHVVPVDLGERGAVEHVIDRARDVGGAVDILINSAGFGLYGRFVETSWQTEHQMIHVNVAALTELTKRLLPEMVARNHGRVMNLASTAAFVPGPLMAVYYATKAYVLSFTEAVAEEVRGSGVTVTALCPGPTASGFQSAANLEESRLVAGKNLQSSADVARFGYRAMMAGKTVAVPGLTNKAVAAMPRLLPRRAVSKIVLTAQQKR